MSDDSTVDKSQYPTLVVLGVTVRHPDDLANSHVKGADLIIALAQTHTRSDQLTVAMDDLEKSNRENNELRRLLEQAIQARIAAGKMPDGVYLLADPSEKEGVIVPAVRINRNIRFSERVNVIGLRSMMEIS